MVRVSATVSVEDMSRAVRSAGAREIERRANRYGQEMVERVPVVLQAKGVDLARPDDRRRSSGTRLADGWGYQVEGNPDSFPILLTLTASGDADYLKRIEYLDKGTPPHRIHPRRPDGWLAFPTDGVDMAFARSVRHPGSTKARGFIRQVMSSVIGIARGRQR